ncbi:MAG: hypothetical protein A2008_09900 [Candidatus Wallbacteria bacterium GWC2_49_35]|uniref:Uncharacterized protein n=1 Tax=Candidatus Wallbacteria bacterium GWC2_49_35 TaxID=1817813 RepID=A0A1F7WDR6_9BACT|nr:MAG: hypothetical protein A2008_09900 [Candidatus Wallbacteria bacterium GWC2_49_35]HBC75954.1 hypothetical protein [Candidatus Wallbacteria bacterium]
MEQQPVIDLQKLIGLINDPSAKIKIDGLRAIDNIKDWSVYSVSEIKQLFEILDQNINYPRSDVRLHVEHAHTRVKKALSELMTSNPLDFASSISEELVSDEEPDAASKSHGGRHSAPAAKNVKSYARENLDNSSSAIASSVETVESSGGNESPEPPPDAPTSREAKNAAMKSKASSKPKPQMIVVYASPESRLAKYFLTLVSIAVFAVFLFVAYPQITANTDAGKIAMGMTAAYLFFLLCPVTYVSSGTKIRIALISLIGTVFYLCFASGLGVDFQLAERLKQLNLSPMPETFNLNEFIIKISILLTIVSATIIFLADDHLGRGFRIFLFMLGAYSMASIGENLMTSAGVKEIFLENGGVGQKIPFIYLKPFYFAANIFLPVCLITLAFEFLSDLFEFSFRKLFTTFTSAVLIAGSCAFFFYYLNDFSVVNVSNIVFAQTINIDKISSSDFYGSVHMFIAQKGDIKESVLDRLRVARAEIYANTEVEPENKAPEKILPGPLKNPCISPNGYYLAFVSYDGKKSDIMFYNLKTRGETKAVVDDGAFNDFPVFSPASDKIAFISNKSGADNIYVINIDKSGLKQITNTATQKSHLVWAPQRNSISYLENGALIRLPLETGKNEFNDPREKAKLLVSVAEKLVPNIKLQCDISTLKPDLVNIKYKTASKNLAEVFQEIATIMISAVKVFEETSGIEKICVSVSYFNDRIEITTFPAIIKQNLEDVKFVNAERIKIWLKNSTVYVNEKAKIFE